MGDEVQPVQGVGEALRAFDVPDQLLVNHETFAPPGSIQAGPEAPGSKDDFQVTRVLALAVLHYGEEHGEDDEARHETLEGYSVIEAEVAGHDLRRVVARDRELLVKGAVEAPLLKGHRKNPISGRGR